MLTCKIFEQNFGIFKEIGGSSSEEEEEVEESESEMGASVI